MSRLNKARDGPLFCYVTDRRSLSAAQSTLSDRGCLSATQGTEARETLLHKVAGAAAAGVDWIQIREKDLSGKELSQLVRAALQCAESFAVGAVAGDVSPFQNTEAGAEVLHPGSVARLAVSRPAETRRARILVNDRLDVALAVEADGVHLGEKGLPPQVARRLVKALRQEENFLIGVSCHSLEAAKAAEHGGADYLFFGPVFATPSKSAYGGPQGLERLAEVCRIVSIPVLAIGGIMLENCAACFSAGASGIAAIRLFQDATDLSVVVPTLRRLSSH